MKSRSTAVAVLALFSSSAVSLTAQASASDTVTSSRPVFVANGQRVAYISRVGQGQPSQAHIVGIDGRSDQLIDGTATATDIMFSPDERRILFRTLSLPAAGAPQTGSSDLPMHFVIADADGRHPQTIASGQTLSSGSWSPDGKQIVYTTRPGRRGVPSSIMLVDVDGSNARELSAGLPLVEPATWSRDGKLAFVRRSDAGTKVMIADRFGRNAHELAPSIEYQSTPTWSSDGKQIAFHGAGEPIGPGTLKHLYVANADGSGLHQLIADATGLLELQFSPDGSQITFSTSRNKSTTNTDIYVIDVSGQNERQLTTDPAFDEDPQWSPDGTRILFQSTRSGTARVYVMTADGMNVRLIR